MEKFMRAFLTIVLVLMFAQSALANDQSGISVVNGATDVITYFTLRDRAASTVDVGVVIANLEMYYIEDQAAQSADVFVGAHGAVTDAHTDGECIHVGHGVYRFDWEDGAFDGGIGKRVKLIVVDGDAGAFTSTMWVELSKPVNVISVAGTAQTANDNGADINTIVTAVGTTIPGTITTAQNDLDTITGASGVVLQDGTIVAATIANSAIDNATFAADVGSTAHGTNIIALACRKNLEELNLDHLMKTAVVSNADMTAEVTDGTVLSNIMSKTSDTSTYVVAEDSLEALADRIGTAIITTNYHIPSVIDIAGTATIRFSMTIKDSIDNLPTTGEITPGTIKIERKPINGTTWAVIVNDEACLEVAGLVYYDEILNTASGYREEDTLRITFKSQAVVAGGNTFEINGSTGAIFHSYIRKALPDVIYRPW